VVSRLICLHDSFFHHIVDGLSPCYSTDPPFREYFQYHEFITLLVIVKISTSVPHRKNTHGDMASSSAVIGKEKNLDHGS
jgi:hypothetical protein